MSQIPPRPSHRPTRTSTFESTTKATPQDTNESNETPQSREPSPPPRPLSRPIRIQPADPEAPHYKAKSELHQTLEKLDTPDAALNPDTIRKFEEVRDKLDEEGPGGSTAACIKYPALGPQKSYAAEEHLSSTNASTDVGEPEEATKDAVSSPIKLAASEANLSKDESSATELVTGTRVPEERSLDAEAKSLSSEDFAVEFSQISNKSTPPEDGLSGQLKSGKIKESRADTAIKPEFEADAGRAGVEEPSNLKSVHSIQSSEEQKLPEIKRELQKSVSSGSSLVDPLAPESDKVSVFSSDRNGSSESEEDAAAKAIKRDDTRPDAMNWPAAELSPKSSDAQGSLEKLGETSPKSQFGSIDVSEQPIQRGRNVSDEPSRALLGNLEPELADPHDGASVYSLNSENSNRVASKKDDSKKDVEVGSSEGSKLIDATDTVSSKSSRPSKPLAPKPKSAMASRFEAALRQNEESKPKIAPKPKPRLAGSGGRIAALQASMFADLNAALSRGPLPGGKPRVPSDAEGSPSSAERHERNPDLRNDPSSQDSRDTAETQIKAMPKLPQSRAAGPNRRRRLPENAKPKYVIVSPKNPLWEILEPQICKSSGNSKAETPASEAANNDESGSVPTIGSKTELNLRDALVRSLSSSDTNQSSDGKAGRSDQASQEPSTKSETESTDDDIMSNLLQLSQRGLPSLGSLVDQSPSPVATPNDGIKAGPTDTINDDAPKNKSPGDSAGLLNVSLSQYLDKSPLTSEPSPKIEKMKATGSYFPSSASLPENSDSSSSLGAIENELNHDEVSVEKKDIVAPTQDHVLPSND